MPATPGQPHDIQTATVIALLVGTLCVVYWRLVLRLIAIALIALAIFGAVLAVRGHGL